MKQPRRLLQHDGAPAALRDALRALEGRGPSPDALLRMRAKLPATAPAAVSGGVVGTAGSGVAGSGVGLSHIVLLGFAATAALTLQNPKPPLNLERAQSEVPALVTLHAEARAVDANTREPDEAIASPTTPRELDTAVVRQKQPSFHGAAGPRRARSSAIGRASAPPRSSGDRLAQSSEVDARSNEPAQLSERASSNERAELGGLERPNAPAAAAAAAESEPQEPVALQPKAASAPRTPAAALDPQDEASFLYRAKRLAARDPQAALHLLEAHSKYFPKGALAEERDVLSIQLHRKLGDAAGAQRMAAQFRTRFPNSVYFRSVAP
jgi:hypothetical protein